MDFSYMKKQFPCELYVWISRYCPPTKVTGPSQYPLTKRNFMETTSQPTIDEIFQSEQLSTLREGLRRKKLTRPTLLQQAFWPVISYGINKKTSDVDFILTAPTGTGKTLTFLVAAIGWLIIEQEKITSEMVKNEAIISPAKPGRPMILCVAPTRELVVQVFRESLLLTSEHAGAKSAEDIFTNDSDVNDSSCTLRQGWLSSACLYGGVPPYHQVRLLERGVHLLVSTPGRLKDLLEQERLCLEDVRCLVFDEYDRLLMKPLKSQADDIASKVSSTCRKILVSATTPAWVNKSNLGATASPMTIVSEENATIIRDHCPWVRAATIAHFEVGRPTRDKLELDPSNVSVHPAQIVTTLRAIVVPHDSSSEWYSIAARLIQSILYTRKQERDRLVDKTLSAAAIRMLIFVETRMDSEMIAKRLRHELEVEFLGTLHGGLDQGARFRALRKFSGQSHLDDEHHPNHSKAGLARVGGIPTSILLCTDVAARGLHLAEVTDVVSFSVGSMITGDVDEHGQSLVHRTGRVGRSVGSGSESYSHILFLTPLINASGVLKPLECTEEWARNVLIAGHIVNLITSQQSLVPGELSEILVADSLSVARALYEKSDRGWKEYMRQSPAVDERRRVEIKQKRKDKSAQETGMLMRLVSDSDDFCSRLDFVNQLAEVAWRTSHIKCLQQPDVVSSVILNALILSIRSSLNSLLDLGSTQIRASAEATNMVVEELISSLMVRLNIPTSCAKSRAPGLSEWADDVIELHIGVVKEVLLQARTTRDGAVFPSNITIIESSAGFCGIYGIIPILLATCTLTDDTNGLSLNSFPMNVNNYLSRISVYVDRNAPHPKHSASCDNCGADCILKSILLNFLDRSNSNGAAGELSRSSDAISTFQKQLPDYPIEIVVRSGGLSSGSAIRSLLHDVNQLSSESGLVSILCVLTGCGLSALRCIQFVEVFSKVSTTKCAFVILPGCLPDPTFDHRRNKSVYLIGRNHIAASDLHLLSSMTNSAEDSALSGPGIQMTASVSQEISERVKRWTLYLLHGLSALFDDNKRFERLNITCVSSNAILQPIIIIPGSIRSDAGRISSEFLGASKFDFGPVMLSVKAQLLWLLDLAAGLITQRSAASLFSLHKTESDISPDGTIAGLQVSLVRVPRTNFETHGYAAEHYVKALPDSHALCYELFLVPGPTPSLHHGRQAQSDEPDVPGRPQVPVETVGIAFVAFGVYNCGASMPWLPFGERNENKFDVSQVDRLVVKPRWRGQGAKELLLQIGGEAFHSLGLPMRIKTASETAHASFLACTLLQCEGHRGKAKCGTGRGTREGWVHWYAAAPVVDRASGRSFSFVGAEKEGPDNEPPTERYVSQSTSTC